MAILNLTIGYGRLVNEGVWAGMTHVCVLQPGNVPRALTTAKNVELSRSIRVCMPGLGFV